MKSRDTCQRYKNESCHELRPDCNNCTDYLAIPTRTDNDSSRTIYASKLTKDGKTEYRIVSSNYIYEESFNNDNHDEDDDEIIVPK